MTDESIESTVTNEGLAAEATPSPETSTDGYESAAENPEILAAFDRVFGDKTDAEVESGEGEEPTADEATEEAPAEKPEGEGSQAEEQQPKPEAKQPIKPAAGKEAAKPATLDPSLIQAAKRNKWTDEQIDRLVKADPELAKQTFGNLHGAYNDLSQQYARLAAAGQQRPQQQQQPGAQQQQPPAQQQTPAGLDALYAKLEEFAKNNGSELVDQLIKPLYAEVIQPFRQMQAAYATQQRAAMASEINNVFKGFGDHWKDTYGEAGKLNAQQNEARFTVARMADQIRSGANLQGIEMPVGEALDRAHALFTADRQQQAARQEIAGQVQRRSKAISARPTQRRNAGQDGARGDKAALAAVQDFWSSRGE